ncbi:McrC family protein [Streptomyces lasiicapitis]|uniref:McrC family protein n=1 Tax=Streptomyces lasiicapitis TaxID=1923961 RepID=UPI0036C48D52
MPHPSGGTPRPVVALREYGTAVVDGVALSTADRRLCAAPALADRLTVRELAGGHLELTAHQHVGVVQLDACEIRVRPKYLGEDLDVLRMLAYAADGSCPPLDALRTADAGAPNLRDLVALLVTEHGERLLAHGARRDYVTSEEDLTSVRGRLLVDRQVLRHYGRLDRLACRFDEHDADILDNRLCAAATDLAARTTRAPAVRARARRAAARFAALAPGPLGDVRAALAGLDYHRHNERYRAAHRWAALLLTGGGISDLFASGPLAARAFLVDMNTLFEAFTTRLLTDAAAGTGHAVRDQSRQRGVLHDERTGTPYGEIRPDVLVTGPDLRLPVDVKYKLYEAGARGGKLSTADLYQAFLYAHALARQPQGRMPTCVLVHPGGPSAPRESVAVRRWDGGTSARVRSLPLDLPGVLRELGGPGRTEALGRVWGQLLPT